MDWFSADESIRPRQVYLGDNSVQFSVGKGSFDVRLFVDGKRLLGTKTDVCTSPLQKICFRSAR